MTKLNIREKIASSFGVGILILTALSLLNEPRYLEQKKVKFNQNNTNYYVIVDEGFFNSRTYYIKTYSGQIIPRGERSEIYIAKEKNSILRLYSYTRINNDTIESKVEEEYHPEFQARQDTLEMIYNEYIKLLERF